MNLWSIKTLSVRDAGETPAYPIEALDCPQSLYIRNNATPRYLSGEYLFLQGAYQLTSIFMVIITHKLRQLFIEQLSNFS